MEFLAGLHPILVHFPIALLFFYFFVELSGLLFKKEVLHSFALIILIIGVAMAIAAAITGNQSFELMKPSLKGKSQDLILMIDGHEEFASLTLWYFVGLLFLRIWFLIKKKFSLVAKIVCLILGLIGCVLIIQTGLLGGRLVYEFGIGTKLFYK